MTALIEPEAPVMNEEERGSLAARILREAANWSAVRKSPYGLVPVLILSWGNFFILLSVTLSGLASPLILRDLHISIADLIRFGGLVSGVSLFVGLAVGHYGDRHRRLPVFGIGMIVAGAIHGLSARAGSLVAYATPTVVSGALVRVAQAPEPSLSADYYPPEVRGRAFAIGGSIAVAATTFAPLIVAALLANFGWRMTYVIVSAAIVLIGVLALTLLREPVRGYMERRALGEGEEEANREDDRPSFAESWRTMWSIRTLRRIFLSNIALGFATLGANSVSTLIYYTHYQLGTTQIGVIGFVGGAVSLVAVYLGGGMIDVINQRWPGGVFVLLGLSLLVGGVTIAGQAFAPPLWLFIGLHILFLFAYMVVQPGYQVATVQVLPASIRTLGVQIFPLAQIPSLLIFTRFIANLTETHSLFAVLAVSAPIWAVAALMLLGAGPLFEHDTRAAFAADAAAAEIRRSREREETKLLVCRDVDVAYDGVQVLFGVDFDLREGEIVALLGTNGAGKSTLLRAISGTQEASGGAIVYDLRDITHMPPEEIARRGVIHMPGGRGVFPGLTVRENLLLGTWMLDPAEAEQRLPDVLAQFPILRERETEPAAALSGGEQQMLSLAQAFLARPRLLMIDELSLGLSPAVVGQLLDAVRLVHSTGATVVIVEQSVNVALSIAERAIFMEKGEVKFIGQTADLMRRPDILRAVYVKGTSGVADIPRARATGLAGGRPVLELAGVRKTYGGITAVDGVTLEVREGQTLGMIGPNGSGKTTLFDLISGYQRVDAGTITFDGADITALAPEERARRRLVRRFQDARLFPSLTVYETLLVALDQRLDTRSLLLTVTGASATRRSERRIRARADRLIELLELGAFRDKFVKELSTGVRRIVDLACVLATEPKLLLLDEPSSGIAQAEAENLAPLLRRVGYETAATLLVIEHDIPLITAIADELVALDSGQVIARGSAADVLNDELVVAAYLGGSEAAVKRSGLLS